MDLELYIRRTQQTFRKIGSLLKQNQNVQSDYLENNPNSDGYIKNRAATVTVEDAWHHEEGQSQVFQVDYNVHRLLGIFLNGQKLISQQIDPRANGYEILMPLLGLNHVVVLYETLEIAENIHGLEFDANIKAPEVQYVGNKDLNTSKPIQSKLRRCLAWDDGSINYYTHKNNTDLKEDGAPSTLDGTDGQVMVHIPRFWFRDTTEGNMRTILFSETPFLGATEQVEGFRAAYEASLDRRTNKLSSVRNLTADFRGGNNDSSLDNSNEFISQLGKAVTSTSRINFRVHAQNRGENWLSNEISLYELLAWLQVHDIGTRNTQAGLSVGLTALSSAEWLEYNGRYPLTQCGVTNSLGNSNGEIDITLTDYPTAGQAKVVKAFSWRGFENFYGHIWEWAEGINVLENKYYRNPRNRRKQSNTDVDGYEYIGNRPTGNGYIKKMYPNSILPMEVGGSSATYYADYLYTQDVEAMRGLLLGGSAAYGARAGSFVVNTYHAPTFALTNLGSRLCFLKR